MQALSLCGLELHRLFTSTTNNLCCPCSLAHFQMELFFSSWEDIVINTNPHGFRRPLPWLINAQLVLELDAPTAPYGPDLKGSKGFQQLIPTAWTKLKNGARQWWLCPECRRRCGVLYFDNGFGCRHCIKPAYECQNGSRTDYLAKKIRELCTNVLGIQNASDDVLCSIYDLSEHEHLLKNRYSNICERIQTLQAELASHIKV